MRKMRKCYGFIDLVPRLLMFLIDGPKPYPSDPETTRYQDVHLDNSLFMHITHIYIDP